METSYIQFEYFYCDFETCNADALNAYCCAAGSNQGCMNSTGFDQNGVFVGLNHHLALLVTEVFIWVKKWIDSFI
jgi:hypothetical protein